MSAQASVAKPGTQRKRLTGSSATSSGVVLSANMPSKPVRLAGKEAQGCAVQHACVATDHPCICVAFDSHPVLDVATPFAPIPLPLFLCRARRLTPFRLPQVCESCEEKELVKIETEQGNYWCGPQAFPPDFIALKMYLHMLCCVRVFLPVCFLASFAGRACPQFKKFERGQGCAAFFTGISSRFSCLL